jgi:hypothetical protein
MRANTDLAFSCRQLLEEDKLFVETLFKVI